MILRHWFRKYIGVVAVVSAAAALAGWQPLPLAGSQRALRIHVGEKAPGFNLPAAAGGLVKLANFRGRNVLLDFYEGYW